MLPNQHLWRSSAQKLDRMDVAFYADDILDLSAAYEKDAGLDSAKKCKKKDQLMREIGSRIS